MRESGLEEKAAGVWISGDLELKGVLCLGGSQCFVAFLITNVLLMNQGGTG